MAAKKQYSKRKRPAPSEENMSIRLDDMLTFKPLTLHQTEVYESWRDNNNVVLIGTAGTGKTFLAMYLALEEVMDPSTPYDKLAIIRSIVPTREIGYLSGSAEEKINAYTSPYRAIATELFDGDPKAYDKLVANKYIEFESTSFLRGKTYDNAIILVDECQNCNFHENDSIITRVGMHTRIIFSGDYKQSDFKSERERSGINKFIEILEHMKYFDVVHFTWEDIVRSDIVREYIMTKEFIESGGSYETEQEFLTERNDTFHDSNKTRSR